VAQSNQATNYFTRKPLQRYSRIFSPENCKKKLTGELMNTLKQDL